MERDRDKRTVQLMPVHWADPLLNRKVIMKYQHLNEMTPGVIELQTRIAVNEKDGMAGKLLDYLCDELLPEDATNGDAFDVLEAALWWLNLSAAEGKAIKMMKSAQQKMHPARYCSECNALLEDRSVYCDVCGTDAPLP